MWGNKFMSMRSLKTSYESSEFGTRLTHFSTHGPVTMTKSSSILLHDSLLIRPNVFFPIIALSMRELSLFNLKVIRYKQLIVVD